MRSFRLENLTRITLVSFLSLGSSVAAGTSAFSPTCRSLLQSDVQVLSTGSDPSEKSRLSDSLQSILRRRGPFGQEVGVQLVQGSPRAYGTRKGVARARPDVGQLAPVLEKFRLGDFEHQGLRIEEVLGISGSAVERPLFGDLDMELTLVVNGDDIRETDLHDPNSRAVQALVAYLQAHVQKLPQSGFVFSDFKAGEHDHVPDSPAAQKNRSRSIKWSISEILQGFKAVPSRNGQPVRLSLSEAITQEARIKIDWFGTIETSAEIASATGLKERFMEYNLLVMFGARRARNGAVLRLPRQAVAPEPGAVGGVHISFPGRAVLLPLRVTTAFFSPEEMELARQLSVTAPAPQVHWVNQKTILAARDLWNKGDRLKAVKRLLSRLHYWNDVEVYNLDRKLRGLGRVDMATVLSGLESVAFGAEVAMLHHLSEMTNALAAAKELGARVSTQTERRQLAGIVSAARQIGVPVTTSHRKLLDVRELSSQLKKAIESKVIQEIEGAYWLKDYLDFVLNGPIDGHYRLNDGDPFFLSFELPTAFRRLYQEWFEQAKIQHPRLELTHPDDLHMTIAYVGAMDADVQSRFWEIVKPFSEKMKQIPWTYTTPRLDLIGEGNSQLALIFDSAQTPPEMLNLILELKSRLNTLGVRLDRHAGEFLPHVSIAYSGGMRRDLQIQRSVHTLLSEDGLIARVKGIEMTGLLEVLRVSPRESGRRYSAATPSDMNPIDVGLEDFN